MDKILDGSWRVHGDRCDRLTPSMIKLPRFVATYPVSFGEGWTMPQEPNCTLVDLLMAICLSTEEKLCAGKAWLVRYLMSAYAVNKTCMAKLLVYTLAFIEGKQAANAMQILLPMLSTTNVQSMAMACIKNGATHKDVLINCATA